MEETIKNIIKELSLPVVINYGRSMEEQETFIKGHSAGKSSATYIICKEFGISREEREQIEKQAAKEWNERVQKEMEDMKKNDPEGYTIVMERVNAKKKKENE